MNAREELIEKSIAFLGEFKNRTAGAELEIWLNEHCGPGSELYEDLARLIRQGVEEGWAADVEISGKHYRRSRLVEPSERTHYFSLTTVFMDSYGGAEALGHTPDADYVFRGDYHLHPYGELNLVVPLDPDAQLMGPLGWRSAGWTAPSPGSHHYPEARRGRLIAYFFLPAGRISYDISPLQHHSELDDIPGTVVFTAKRSKQGYWVNQFCMSLMKEVNRERFRANERAYLDDWKMTEEQKQAVMARDWNKLLSLGGNIYFLAKLFFTDGNTFQYAASQMTNMSEDDYVAMMLAGGRSPEGVRSISKRN
ncbi:protocatechuate 4,5-dioxygenase subunit alpha [Dyella humicola]|uniref:protocatechuate 4,5-dioxygenase subunit alpha n=1 Tax=Dyella humicola TaxID=2992126 RepID=UPI00224F6121|nr:protocatechuate 4,5-dioxygenase subunit alpha [Dyella humicola]